MPFTFSDDASSFAQLALIALNNELDTGVSHQPMTTKYTTAALRLVRKKLVGMTELPSDFLVGSVALLLIIEVILPDIFAHSISELLES